MYVSLADVGERQSVLDGRPLSHGNGVAIESTAEKVAA